MGGYSTESRVPSHTPRSSLGAHPGSAPIQWRRERAVTTLLLYWHLCGPAPSRKREQKLQTGYGEYLFLRPRRIGEAPDESACFYMYQSPHVSMVRGEQSRTGLMQHYPCSKYLYHAAMAHGCRGSRLRRSTAYSMDDARALPLSVPR